MRNILLSIMMALVVTLPLGAMDGRDDLPPGLDPARDSLNRKEFRARMDSIRIRRPVVALVLMGGGAKGAAHVGVIQRLEELDIPVDMVLGTSMGGLIGGMYAVGYDACRIDTLIRAINWDVALTDEVPKKYKSYAERKYGEKYVLSFPFYYSKKDFLKQKEEASHYGRKHDDLHFGAEGGSNVTSVVKDNILGSLPSGLVYGQNVNNIFSSLTVGYQDSTKFVDLPVPFVCVATEMVTGKAKVWYEGKLNTALRSTMSIPGLFTPVRTDGMILVDGGMRDNYPTTLAKELGADIIIGVNISSGYKDYSGINNFGDLLGQFVDMFGRAAVEQNLTVPYVTVKPDITGYDMMSFDSASIDTLIHRGYAAACREDSLLLEVKSRMNGEGHVWHNVPARNLGSDKVRISGIEVKGVDDDESLLLMNKIKLNPLQSVGSGEIEDAEATMFGTGAFDYVTYQLEGKQEPYRLVFNSRKGPINQLGLGARFDSEEVVSAILNLGISTHKLSGFRLDLTGKVGTNPYSETTLGYMTKNGFSVNGSVLWHYTDRNMFSFGDNDFKLDYFSIREQIYLSNLKWSWFDLKMGIRNEYFSVKSIMAEKNVGDYDLLNRHSDNLGPFFDLRCDTFDNGYFPNRGMNLGINYAWMLSPEKDLIENSFHVIQFDGAWVVPISRSVHILPSVNSRYLLGDNIPVAYTNMMGGSIKGRYLEQQMAFIGINHAAAMGNFLTVLRSDLRVQLFKNNYLSLIGNYALSFNDIDDVVDMTGQNGTLGLGLQYSYNTVIGPITANIHWSDYNHKVGIYLSMGFDF